MSEFNKSDDVELIISGDSSGSIRVDVEKEKALPIVYKEIKLNHGYRIDLLVNKKVVIEIKTVEYFTDVHTAQVITYLKLGGYRLGLLLNFHVTTLKNGIKRIIN